MVTQNKVAAGAHEEKEALVELLALRPGELATRLGGSGRAKEVWQVLKKGLDPFSVGPLGDPAARRLADRCKRTVLDVAQSTQSSCGTTKWLLALPDGTSIETVLIPSETRTTVCVSCQVGCGRGCVFCATATMGLGRSLSTAEIVAQIQLALARVNRAAMPPLRNVVFMGMGEPLDNWVPVRQAVAVLTDPLGYAFAPKHVTISTVGTSPNAVRKLTKVPAQIAWSIHTVEDGLRRQLVPTSRYPMVDLRRAFLEVVRAKRQPIFVEMTLIKDQNDGDAHAQALAEFLQPFQPEVRVNLLPMNPARAGLIASGPERAVRFRQLLRSRGYFCAIRHPRGAEQNAACGQLATQDPPASGKPGQKPTHLSTK